MILLSSADFFQNWRLKKIFQEHNQSIKHFGSRSGQTFCWSRFWYKRFAKVISRRQKLELSKESNASCVKIIDHSDWSGLFLRISRQSVPYDAGKSSILFCRLLIFFKINIFKKFFQEYQQSVKQFGPRSGPTCRRAWPASKLFAKVISRRH